MDPANTTAADFSHWRRASGTRKRTKVAPDNQTIYMKGIRMNLIAIRTVIISGLVAGSLLTTRPALGDAALHVKPAAAEKIYEGTVLAVDAAEQTLTVKGRLLSKSFNATGNCQITLEDKPGATLAHLRPGHKVEVRYQKVHGVLVAGKISQHNQMLTGYITAVNPGERTLTVKHSGRSRDFVVMEQHEVLLKDNKVGTLENLKIGHSVSVAYHPAAGAWTTHKIVQQAESFVGTIQAIDAGARTVRARSYLNEQKFHLADQCQIVVANQANASLRDLRIGDRVEFTYENTAGVLVTTRIGRETNPEKEESAQSAKLTAP